MDVLIFIRSLKEHAKIARCKGIALGDIDEHARSHKLLNRDFTSSLFRLDNESWFTIGKKLYNEFLATKQCVLNNQSFIVEAWANLNSRSSRGIIDGSLNGFVDAFNLVVSDFSINDQNLKGISGVCIDELMNYFSLSLHLKIIY